MISLWGEENKWKTSGRFYSIGLADYRRHKKLVLTFFLIVKMEKKRESDSEFSSYSTSKGQYILSCSVISSQKSL